MALNSVASWLMRSSESLNDKLDLSRSDSTEAHVLAVDDSLVDLKVIEKLLKTSSCKDFLKWYCLLGSVTAVDSGIRALEFLGLNAEKSPANFDSLKVDLIITDYCMPGMNGYELLKKIKESSVFREIPVVIMSSENVVARIKRCLEEGAEAFLMKPVKPSDVKLLKDYMTKDSSGKADATTTAAGDRDSYSNLKRKLRESSSDDQFPSPPSTSPSSSSAPSLSSSPSQSMGSSSSSSPDSSSPLESPTRRLGMTNSY